jgi:DNA-directed RNA polymerase specialized sigma24 family protein
MLEAVRQGAPDAQSQLFERFAPQIRALLRRHRGLAEAQLEEEVSRVFAQLCERLVAGQWPNASSFTHELRAMLTAHYAAPVESTGPSLASAATAKSAPLVNEHLQKTVERLLAELPQTLERETLLRFYVQAQTPEQICTELRVPPEQLRQLLQQIRKRIREAL